MFVDMACDMGLHLWQVLPLGPTGYGDSPYQSLSSFAANPLLISLDDLINDGLLSPSACSELMCLREDRVDFGRMIPLKQKCLAMAADAFLTAASPSQRHAFDAFCRASREWLADYALFDTLKTAQGGGAGVTWPTEIAQRDPSALKKVTRALSREITRTKVIQFFFH
jgi:4-alpha-glucanotransferase